MLTGFLALFVCFVVVGFCFVFLTGVQLFLFFLIVIITLWPVSTEWTAKYSTETE